jgi:hypothetical protein
MYLVCEVQVQSTKVESLSLTLEYKTRILNWLIRLLTNETKSFISSSSKLTLVIWCWAQSRHKQFDKLDYLEMIFFSKQFVGGVKMKAFTDFLMCILNKCRVVNINQPMHTMLIRHCTFFYLFFVKILFLLKNEIQWKPLNVIMVNVISRLIWSKFMRPIYYRLLNENSWLMLSFG